jgi:MFS transporter, DHA1 family, staphyloferrin A biosynthesis exporter
LFKAGMFASLQHRNYRYFWVGTLVSNIGDWMDNVAFNWLMWELTGSGAFLGLLALFRAAPILVFTLFGGALADRMERRRLLQITQSAGMFLALLLSVLVLTDVVTVWQVFAIAAGRGIMMSINMPTRQAMLSDIVDREHLTNAIALNSATMNLTRVLGGSIGGILITLIGTGGVFMVNGLSFTILIITLALMTIPPMAKVAQRRSILRSIGDGLSYIKGSNILLSLIILALAPMIFGMPYMTLLPIFADEVLGIGNEGYGVLVAFTGIGAMVGALTIAGTSNMRHRGRVMLIVMIAFGIMLFAFSRSADPTLSYALLLGVGAGQTTYMALNNTLLQTHASDEMRGRVMSVFFLNRGMVPLGTVGAGFATEFIGVQWTVSIMAIVLIALGLTAFAFLPRLRALE